MAKRVELHLNGGLGNQLFQYSAGLYLANLWDSKLELNLTRIAHHHTEIPFAVTSFNLDSDRTIVRKIYLSNLDLLRTKFIRARAKKLNSSQDFQSEFEMIYHQSDGGIRNFNNHLFGYYGDFKFFDSLEPFQKVCNLVNPSRWYSNFLLANRQGFNAIHMRLGDYLSDINHYGVLSPEYYRKILESLSNYERSFPTYVFTDDVRLSKTLFSGPIFKKLIFVEPPAHHDPAESLMIMSKARILISANSTFSFWAGKLASPLSKVLVPSVNPAGELFVRNIPASWGQVEPIWMTSEEFKRSLP